MIINSIPCKECKSFEYCKKYESENAGAVNGNGVWLNVMSPIRKCQHAIAEKHFYGLSNVDVLEVGCGNSGKGGFIKKEIIKNGCMWTGIDPQQSDLTDIVCGVEKMPFKDGSFDIVIGNQTIEHWDNIKQGLTEVRRVMKVGATAFLNAPIHLHGSRLFVEGNFKGIQKLFKESKLSLQEIELWRKDYDGLNFYLPFESLNSLKKHEIKNEGIQSAYVANFIAVRK